MRLRNRTRIISVICLLFWSIAYGQSDSLVYRIPSSSLADISMITVPDGFVQATNFNGYLNSKLGSSIIMTLIENVDSPAMDDAWEQDPSRTFVSRDSLTTTNGYNVFMYKEETQAQIAGKTELIKIFQYTVFIGSGEKVLWLSISHSADIDELLQKGIMNTIMNADLTPGI